MELDFHSLPCLYIVIKNPNLVSILLFSFLNHIIFSVLLPQGAL